MKHATLIPLAIIAVAISTCARGAEASGIGGCPLPLAPVHKTHHARPAAPVPLCTCTAEPRVIILPAPTPDIEPIELNVLRYYVPLTADVEYEPQPYQWDDFHGAYAFTGGGGGYQTTPSVRAPEIDTRGGVTAVTILALVIFIATGRRPRS